MRPVIQEEKTGCAIACAAAIVGTTYQVAKKVANEIGVCVNDSALWSDTVYIRKLLAELGIKVSNREKVFDRWEKLPGCALLSIKWQEIQGKPYWHWVVFVREGGCCYVLDSNKKLKNNIRTDFGRMRPKWYIEVFV